MGCTVEASQQQSYLISEGVSETALSAADHSGTSTTLHLSGRTTKFAAAFQPAFDVQEQANQAKLKPSGAIASARVSVRRLPVPISQESTRVQVRVANPLQRLTDRQVFLILATMTLGVALAALWITRSTNPLRGDSAEYLYFDPSRSVGYPAFLSFFGFVTGNVALAVPAQTLLLAASLLLLGWRFHRLFRKPVYAIAFQLLVLANAGMWFTSAFLMTEALSTALVALFCAQVLLTVEKPSAAGSTMLVATSCCATMVRPSLVALFAGAALFAFLAEAPRDRLRALSITMAGLVAAWGATPIAQFFVHGSVHTTSPLSRGVLQHTLYCDPHAAAKDEDSAFVEQNAAPVRRYIEAAPLATREQFRREYSTPLRFGLIIPVLGRRHQLETRSQVDPYLSRIARERVRANPGCYARSVINEYVRMAAFDADPTSEDAREINAFVRRHPPVQIPQYPILPGDDRLARQAAAEVHNKPSGLNPARQQLNVVAKVPFLALLPLRLVHVAAALFGLAAVAAVAVRRRLGLVLRAELAAAAVTGISLHGILAITAIVEIGFYRYLVPCWPMVCTLIALAGLALAHPIRPQDRSSASTDGPKAKKAAG